MTKKEAAEKIAKLRRLAEKAGTPAEAESARRLADKLTQEHGLTDTELSLGSRAAAFDDLMDELDRFVRKHHVPAAVLETIELVKVKTGKEDKADALGKIVVGVRTVSLFFLFDKTVAAMKTTVDAVLKKHGVTV